MPRKDRKPAPTLAERHKVLASSFRFAGLDRLDAPTGEWRIDAIIASVDQSAPKNTRQLACDAAYRAFNAASGEYEVAAQRAVDLQRAASADRLAQTIAEFTRLEFDELVDGDWAAMRVDRTQSNGATFDMAPLYAAAHRMRELLAEYAHDRRKEPPGTSRDQLGKAFAVQVGDLWQDLGWSPSPATTLHRFALALWRDVGFPLREGVDAGGNAEDWMRSQFR